MSLFPFYFLYHVFPTVLLKQYACAAMALPLVLLFQTSTSKILGVPNMASSLPQKKKRNEMRMQYSKAFLGIRMGLFS
jgi:hypothetical protein